MDEWPQFSYDCHLASVTEPWAAANMITSNMHPMIRKGTRIIGIVVSFLSYALKQSVSGTHAHISDILLSIL